MEEKSQKKRIAIIIGAIVLVLCVAVGIYFAMQRSGGIEVKDTGFLAGGTIPSDAKIYPIMDENIPMQVTGNSNEDLSAEDIWTLTHYVDLFASLDDKAGTHYDPEQVTFLSSTTLEDVLANNEAAGDEYAITSVQVLALDYLGDNRVEATYTVEMTGYADGLEDGDYIAVAGLFFKRVNGNWYEDGIASYCFEEQGTISIDVDSVTGQITVNYI